MRETDRDRHSQKGTYYPCHRKERKKKKGRERLEGKETYREGSEREIQRDMEGNKRRREGARQG